MLSLGFALLRLFKGVYRGLSDPDFRALLLVLLVVVLGGTLFFHAQEGWSWVDSAYFSVMTLATIAPEGFVLTSEFSKIFAIAYVIGGLGVMISFVMMIGRHVVRPLTERKPAGGETVPPETAAGYELQSRSVE